MLDNWRVTLCKYTCLKSLWEMSKSSSLTSPGKRGRPPLRNMLIFLVQIAYIPSLHSPFPLFFTGNARLHSHLDKRPHPTPNPVFENSLHRQLIIINDAYSRWSTGNRGRATSASEVIEVAGSNHAIGVILNLAWGPNNFSPSMIWSWRTRSNSQTGLGAE